MPSPFFYTMAIGRSKLHKMLNRGRLLYDSLAWKYAFDTATKEFVLDLIRNDQLKAKGIDKDGNVIGIYSEVTEMINPEKLAGTHYTLYDEGDFYRSMYVSVFPDRIEINADPVKSPEDNLFELYGTGIIGLTQENLAKLRERIKLKYIEYYKKTLFGSL